MDQETQIRNLFNSLFLQWNKSTIENIIKLPHSGSNRSYYRITSKTSTYIGVYNENYRENQAFLSFTNQFLNSRINVPKIFASNLDQNIYLIEDLGNTQLLNWLISERKDHTFPEEAIEIYKKVIQELIRIQIIAGRNFDYTFCHQHPEFNKESIIYDLNYFKTSYVDALNLKYNQTKLINDFNVFSQYLLNADNNYFMFRDFQARNILLKDNTPYFIDYQGGRKGPLQYDLVSLLFQAKAEIPETIKNILLEYYIGLASLFIPISKSEFIEYYFGFALIRVLQTLGAYGLRGLIEKKDHFIESIPLAIKNLIYLNDKVEILKQLPELQNIINLIINKE